MQKARVPLIQNLSMLSLALIYAYGFIACTWCLSILPQVTIGPTGYGTAVPSTIASWAVALMPTTWFPFFAGPFVFWTAFRACSMRKGGRSVGIALVVFFAGSAAVVIRELLALHATYAAEAPSRGAASLAFNAAYLAVIIWQTLTNELSRKCMLQKPPETN